MKHIPEAVGMYTTPSFETVKACVSAGGFSSACDGQAVMLTRVSRLFTAIYPSAASALG